MERRKALALASLLMILLASFALIVPTSAEQNERLLVMGGTLDACTQLGPFEPTLWDTPFQTREPWLTPGVMEMNVTYSDRWYSETYGYVVNITVHAEDFAGVYHEWYDSTSSLDFNLLNYMKSGEDGYGWIFLDDQKGDVDCYTFHNDTGAYWGPESSLAGDLAASVSSAPSPGPDGVAGTGDDGFGDGTKDPAGSSILILPTYTRCEFWTGSAWAELFDIKWPIVFTTGTSYGIVKESSSAIDLTESTGEGKPQELLHSGTPWDDPEWNIYITYVSCWGMLNVYTPDYGDLDVFYNIITYNVRDDPAYLRWGDANQNGMVDGLDYGAFGATWGKRDEHFGYTPADTGFDARFDFNDNGMIDGLDYGTFGANWPLPPVP
jgi:hypothetical protein